MNLRHISLPRGPERLASRNEVNDKVMSLVTPWLKSMVATGRRCPLVLPAVSHFSASAQARDNTLKVDLWRPAGPFRAERPHRGKTALVATLAVAPDAAAGEPLWSSLLEQGGVPWRAPPEEPWCGVLPAPAGMAGHAKAGRWIGEFQNSVAFAWLAL